MRCSTRIPGLLFLVASTLLMWLASAAPARACGAVAPGTTPVLPPVDESSVHWGIGYEAVAAIDGAIIGAQIAAGGDAFPSWAAGLELGLGAAEMVAGPLLASFYGAAAICGGFSTLGPDLAIGAAFSIAIGGWLVAHAIWSFADGDDDIASPPIAPAITVTADGAALHVLGAF